MFQPRSIQSNLSFKDKIISMDFVLIFSILAIGIISMFACIPQMAENLSIILVVI